MTLEQYLEKRNTLIQEAEDLIVEGKLKESEAKMKDVEQLDSDWEEIKVAQANLDALRDKEDIEDIGQHDEKVVGGNVLGGFDNDIKSGEDAYVEAWAKHLKGDNLTKEEQETIAEYNGITVQEFTHKTKNTPTLIPETVIAGIEKLMQEEYPLLKDVRHFSVPGTLTINRHEAIKDGDAAWYDEDTETGLEENEFGQFTLSGHELSKAVEVTWKMKAMSVREFIPFIQQEIAERMGVALATGVTHGTGEGQPKGIVPTLKEQEATPQVIEYESLEYKDLTNAMSKIHSSLAGEVAIYANNDTVWNTLANILDKNGRPIFIPDVTTGGVGRIFGRTVKVDGSLKAGEVLFGNAKKGYYLNTNESMKLVTQDFARKRVTDYVAYGIYDGDVFIPQAFSLLTLQEV